MNIIQCKMCRKPFNMVNGKICPDCLQKIDRDFMTVRDYIYEHKHADIDTVSKETEVDKAIILHLLKEGRLTLTGSDADEYVLLCEVCKKPIASGRMCDDCMKNIASTMSKSIGDNKKPENEDKKKDLKNHKNVKGMHTRPSKDKSG